MKFSSMIALIAACNAIRLHQDPAAHDFATDDLPANPDGTYGLPA